MALLAVPASPTLARVQCPTHSRPAPSAPVALTLAHLQSSRNLITIRRIRTLPVTHSHSLTRLRHRLVYPTHTLPSHSTYILLTIQVTQGQTYMSTLIGIPCLPTCRLGRMATLITLTLAVLLRRRRLRLSSTRSIQLLSIHLLSSRMGIN